MNLLPLIVLSLLQDPAAPRADGSAPSAADARPARSSEWRVVDAAIVVVNEDIITIGALSRQVARRVRELNIRDDNAAVQRVWNEVATAAVSSRLKVQAGRNMGFDEAQIDRYARDDFERFTDRQGGVVGLTKFLESENLPVDEFRDLRRDLIYSELWEDSVTGEGVSTAARPSRDRYVRPGTLRFEYNLAGEMPGRAEAIGGHGETIDFERVVVPFDEQEPGAQARAKELASSLRQRALDGEDLAQLVEKSGLDKESLQRSNPTEIATARRVYPEADKFFASARPGEICEPILMTRRDKRGYMLLRMDARQVAQVPPLSDVAVQRKVASICQKQFDDFRKEIARRQVEARSYIWQAPAPGESAQRKRQP